MIGSTTTSSSATASPPLARKARLRSAPLNSVGVLSCRRTAILTAGAWRSYATSPVLWANCWRLLGGYRDRVPAYADVPTRAATPGELGEQLAACVAAGYRAVEPAGTSCDGRAPFCILLYVMFFLNVVILALALSATQPPTPKALEREARQIETMLMAPCCWAQPVSQHQSQASEDVKQQIRTLLASGKNRQEVLDAFVSRYGQRILVEPPGRGFGAVLYGGLLITFLLTASGLVLWVRRASRRPAAVTAAMSPGRAADARGYEHRRRSRRRPFALACAGPSSCDESTGA